MLEYFNRLLRLGDSGSSDFDPADDLYVVTETVERYVYGYPNHLDDGTISRGISWFGEGFLEPTREVNLNHRFFLSANKIILSLKGTVGR